MSRCSAAPPNGRGERDHRIEVSLIIDSMVTNDQYTVISSMNSNVEAGAARRKYPTTVVGSLGRGSSLAVRDDKPFQW